MHLRWYTCDFDSPQNAGQSALPYYGLSPIFITGNGAPVLVAEVKRPLSTQKRTVISIDLIGGVDGELLSVSISREAAKELVCYAFYFDFGFVA
jgi:hypothetical protein